MDAEYYTPDVEDIHIGFECEINYPKGWIPIKVEDLYTDSDGYGNAYEVEHTIKNSPQDIRVLCLTKEQIEAEGWKVTQQMMYCEHIMSKDKNSLIYNSVNRELRLFKPIEDMGIELDYNKIVFDGSCKSINEFRVIIKLLNL